MIFHGAAGSRSASPRPCACCVDAQVRRATMTAAPRAAPRPRRHEQPRARVDAERVPVPAARRVAAPRSGRRRARSRRRRPRASPRSATESGRAAPPRATRSAPPAARPHATCLTDRPRAPSRASWSGDGSTSVSSGLSSCMHRLSGFVSPVLNLPGSLSAKSTSPGGAEVVALDEHRLHRAEALVGHATPRARGRSRRDGCARRRRSRREGASRDAPGGDHPATPPVEIGPVREHDHRAPPRRRRAPPGRSAATRPGRLPVGAARRRAPSVSTSCAPSRRRRSSTGLCAHALQHRRQQDLALLRRRRSASTRPRRGRPPRSRGRRRSIFSIVDLPRRLLASAGRRAAPIFLDDRQSRRPPCRAPRSRAAGARPRR